MGDYIEIPNVPLFDEHLTDSPKLPAHFGPAELQRVADACNFLRDDTGDYPAIVLRHTGDTNPDPPIIGYAGNFRVGDLGKLRPRKCLYCDFWVKREHEQTVRDHPRRSVELWPDKWVIDPIAILGGEAPERYLGLLRFSASETRETVKISPKPLESDDMSEQEILAFVMKSLAETPEFQFLRTKMQAEAAEEQGEDAAQEAAGEQPEQPVKYMEGGAAPSGNNAYVPAPTPNKKPPMPASATANAEKYAAAAQSESLQRIAKLEADFAAEREKAIKYEAAARKSARVNILAGFRAAGFAIDPHEEADYCERFDDAQFDEHCKRHFTPTEGGAIKYQRAPIGSAVMARIPQLPGTTTEPAGGDPKKVQAKVAAAVMDRKRFFNGSKG